MNRRRDSLTFSRRTALKAAGLGSAVLAAPIIGRAARAQDEVVLTYQNHWSKETDTHYDGMNWLYESFHAATRAFASKISSTRTASNRGRRFWPTALPATAPTSSTKLESICGIPAICSS
jgi:hypothetical protein